MSSAKKQVLKDKKEVVRLFSENIVKFLDALIEILPKEKDLYWIRVLFSTQISAETALMTFKNRIIPYGDMVVNKDERFFIECTDLFAGVRKDKVSYFKDLWASGTLSEEDKEHLWKWFALFLKLAQQYEKLTSTHHTHHTPHQS